MEIDGYTISLNRGDEVTINIQNKENLPFMVGDTIKFSITKKGNMTDVLFKKNFTVE